MSYLIPPEVIADAERKINRIKDQISAIAAHIHRFDDVDDDGYSKNAWVVEIEALEDEVEYYNTLIENYNKLKLNVIRNQRTPVSNLCD